MLNVVPKSAHHPLRSSGDRSLEIHRREQARSITIRGVHPCEFLSFNTIVLVLVVFFLVKVAMINFYGVEGYVTRVEMFLNGTGIEQFSGRLLDIDPITAVLSKLLASIL